MLWFFLYIFLGIVTFILSFYFDSKEISEREGDFDPEAGLNPTFVIIVMVSWPVAVIGYIALRIIKRLKLLCIYFANLGYEHGKPKRD